MAKKKRKNPKYLFIFNEGRFDEIVLPGNSIEDYWNDIYDLFWEEDFVVQKLNENDFTKNEIKELFWSLYGDMSDDFSIIDLKLVNFSRLEFYNLGEMELSFIKRKGKGYELDKASSKTIDEFEEKARHRICKRFLSKAMTVYNLKKHKELTYGFNIKDSIKLRKQQFHKLKRILEYYQKALQDIEKWAFNLYHIVKLVGDRSSFSKLRGILNNPDLKGSRHEGEGRGIKRLSKEDKLYCENKIREVIDKEIIKSGINKK